jgi:hypothetical protein
MFTVDDFVSFLTDLLDRIKCRDAQVHSATIVVTGPVRDRTRSSSPLGGATDGSVYPDR